MENHVFVLAPIGRDAALIADVLDRAHIAVLRCADMAEVVHRAAGGIGALLVAEEAVTNRLALRRLQRLIERQPSWSDLPVLLLTQRGRLSDLAAGAMPSLGNVTVLERPTQVSTLVSAVRTSLRTRERQYEMRQLDARKDMFLATLAHELRNPLAPLSNALHVLGATGLSQPRQQWAASVMQRQIGQLARLVDDLLDVARITRGKITLQPERFDLREAVQAGIETGLPLAEDMEHTLAVEQPPEPLWVHGDRTRVAQCVANLLTNAAKYTPRGGHIDLVLAARDDEAEIRVRDNGIGFAPQDARRLFEVFAQVDHAVPRAQGGLGLGLSIVKALIEMHGGAVHAESDGPGHGATFALRLPRAAPPNESATSDPPDTVDAGSCCRVLVVDDNRDSADSMTEVLIACGHDARRAYDGHEALALMQSWQPQLALLDIGLPDMSGLELARRIRATNIAPRPVLVALTGWGQASDIARSVEAGFDQHLTKPADVERVLQLVERVAGGVVTQTAETVPREAQPEP